MQNRPSESYPNHGNVTQQAQQIIAQIAQKHLGLETLEPRQSDSLDFHDLAVWLIEAALQAAFEAGEAAA